MCLGLSVLPKRARQALKPVEWNAAPSFAWKNAALVRIRPCVAALIRRQGAEWCLPCAWPASSGSLLASAAVVAAITGAAGSDALLSALLGSSDPASRADTSIVMPRRRVSRCLACCSLRPLAWQNCCSRRSCSCCRYISGGTSHACGAGWQSYKQSRLNV